MKEAYGGSLACLELHAFTSTPICLQLDQMEILGSDETQPVRLTFCTFKLLPDMPLPVAHRQVEQLSVTSSDVTFISHAATSTELGHKGAQAIGVWSRDDGCVA